MAHPAARDASGDGGRSGLRAARPGGGGQLGSRQGAREGRRRPLARDGYSLVRRVAEPDPAAAGADALAAPAPSAAAAASASVATASAAASDASPAAAAFPGGSCLPGVRRFARLANGPTV